MRPLLIVRPEPEASATAARAAAMGLEPIVRPLFETRAHAWSPPEPARFDAVMMTSANAARYGGPALADYFHLPLYAVGAATAKAASDFPTIITGDGDAAALIARIAADGGRSVLHLAGREHTEIAAPFPLQVVTVYASDVLAAPEFPDDAVVLLHSARAARRFADLVPARKGLTIVAISAAVAEAAGDGWAHSTIAPKPVDAAMLELAAGLCDMADARATERD